MKKFLSSLIFLGVIFTSGAYAKKVIFCYSYFTGPNIEMDCSGDLKGKYTPLKLYHKGWTLKTDISGANKFILVFEK